MKKDKTEEKVKKIMRLIENLKDWDNRKSFERYMKRKEKKM